MVDSFADQGLLNAQMGNGREIVSRLDPSLFHVSMFVTGEPDERLSSRRNTRLIPLPRRRQTVNILREFCTGDHEVLFYLKASPAARWYMAMRKHLGDSRPVVGTMESQADLHNEPTISPEAIRLWRRTVLRCDYLVSNSAAVRKSLEREYGLKSRIIPVGVDTKFFSPQWNRRANTRPRVLFVGSLRPFKQPQLLLEAAVRFPHADFRVVGDGIMRFSLAERIAREKIHNVALVGPLEMHKLRAEYQAADIFLFPSQWEGSPKVILEAAACGLPMIVRNNYEPETVLHGHTGYKAKNDAEIFEFLAALLCSAELRQKLGHNARRLSLAFDWDIITAQWQELFLSLAPVRLARNAS